MLRAVSVAAAASLGAAAGAVSIGLAMGVAAAQAPRSAALEFFCTHAYRVASFPEALDAISAETEVALSSIAEDATANALIASAAARTRNYRSDTVWSDMRSRIRLFVVGDDCPSVYANPFAGQQRDDWIVTAPVPDGLFDLEFSGSPPRVPRMAFGYYYDARSRLTKLAVFVSRRDPTLLVERLGLLAGYLNLQVRRAAGGWGRIDAASLETVLGHTWLSTIQWQSNVEREAVRTVMVDHLRRRGTPFVELSQICETRSGGCNVSPRRPQNSLHLRIHASGTHWHPD